MNAKLIFAALLACCLSACNTRKCDDLPNPQTGDYFGERRTCPDGNPCSYSLVSISVKVIDATGKPVVLDSFVVTNRAGVPVPPNAAGHILWGASSPTTGHYTVLNDGWVNGHEGLGSYFVAKGFRNGRQLFAETYMISADCCHISKLSGLDEIIIK